MIKEEFGLGRVIEPENTVPVTAWKIDNSKEINPYEIRLSIDRIHVEWDSFQQICTSCGYDDAKIKARILDIVDKRGKLHNPYTGSGGILMGTIDAVGSKVAHLCPHKPGDEVYCVTALMAVPLHIDHIKEIDYESCQFTASGYGICFRPEHLFPVEADVKNNYTMIAIDEAGNFYRTYKLATEIQPKKITILSRDLFTPLVYTEAVKKAMGNSTAINVIIDETLFPGISNEAITELMAPDIQKVYFVDETKPIDTFKDLTTADPELCEQDFVIVGEDIRGAETLAVLLVKDNGNLFFSSIRSKYAQGVFVAETMGKSVKTSYFDQYMHGNQDFTMTLLKTVADKLDKLDDIYRRTKKNSGKHANKLKSSAMETAEKINDFVYQSPVTGEMVEEALNIARYDCNVIIQGETGVGKEKILELIHHNSPRQSKPCIKINCATIQENLAESEFFGYDKGAFTGARDQGKEGYFELANQGTLFLDEIGTLSLTMQSKLLRVLQENRYYRVGGTKQKTADVRVICANNIPLQELVKEGKFREDLYYRLNICIINVPPLRERKEDIVCLAEHFLEHYSKKYGTIREISPEAMELMCDYHWPGNVRELENVVQRLIISSRETIIDEDLVDQLLNKSVYDKTMLDVRNEFRRNESVDFRAIMEHQEKKLIEYALQKEGTTRKAAEFLDLPQATFARKKTRYGL
ncbi:MAG: sigma 54-interacting transcriptional regulator [Bacillota bacterium]|nr:sigma 54-interacting transcriptional regulator [Bacillota bacterium]